jgi:hypothetical protein
MTRRWTPCVLLVPLLAGCHAAPPFDGPERVERSRRLTLRHDRPGLAFERALPVVDATDEALAARWDLPRDERRALVVLSDRKALKAWRDEHGDEALRWPCAAFECAACDALVVDCEPARPDEHDLGPMWFEAVQVARDRDAVVGRLVHALHHARLREALGEKRAKALPRWLREGAAELERVRALEPLDGGFEGPFEPGRSAVERTLAWLRLALHPGQALPAAGADDEVEATLALGRCLALEDVAGAGAVDRALRSHDAGALALEEAAVRARAPLAAAEHLARLVVEHESALFTRALPPTERLMAALRERRAPRPDDVDALLRELGLGEGARRRFAP